MKLLNVEDFKAAMKLIGFVDLEVRTVQAEAEFSSVGVPRLLIEEDEDYERFRKVIRESFAPKELLLVQLNSNVVEFVYTSSHHPRIFPAVFKAFEDFVWRKQNA